MFVTKASSRPRLNASPNATDIPLLDSLSRAGGGRHEASSVVVEEQLLGAVVVREVDVGPAVFVEVRGCCGERPPRAADAELVGHVLELAAADVVEEQVLPAIVRELEAVVHDPCGREVPQIDVAAEICGDVEIEQAIAIVVEPDRAVAVHPATQTGGLRDVLEALAIDVLEQREVAVAVDEQVLAAVVVEVAPDAAHRDAFAGAIQIGEAGARRRRPRTCRRPCCGRAR